MPFVIAKGVSLKHPYKGTAYGLSSKDIIVVYEQWINDIALPFEGHLYSALIKDKKIVDNKRLFTSDPRSLYNPHFVGFKSKQYLIANAYDHSNKTSYFVRSELSRNEFGQLRDLKIKDNLQNQLRPWVFPSRLNIDRLVLTYEWKDLATGVNLLKMAESSDWLHFEASVNLGTGVMLRHQVFANGSRLYTRQNALINQMMDFFSISSDGKKWSIEKPVSDFKNVHDVISFLRGDGNVDFYYISTQKSENFVIYRRSVNTLGILGAEEAISQPEWGTLMQPHPVRLPNGQIFLVATKETKPGKSYDLVGYYLSEDAP